MLLFVFFFKQKTAYEMRISDWSSDVCSSDLRRLAPRGMATVASARMVAARLARRVVVVAGHGRFVLALRRLGPAGTGVAAVEHVQIGSALCRARVCQDV